MIFWCQSCGEQHTSPHVTSANITTCAKCGGSNFATWKPIKSQSLSQEAVRDEVLEEAAKACDTIAFSRECADGTMQGVYDARPYKQCALTIRALKREPNAAAKIGQSYEVMGIEQTAAPAAPDVLGEQPTHFEMARTRMLRKRIADIVATHDAFVADHTNRERAEALRHAIDKARGIGLTKAEQEKQEDYDCPHAYPHRYCETCRVDPCPLGLGKKSPPAPGASDE